MGEKYIISIIEHPINGYSFDYDVVECGKNSVDIIKFMLTEYFQEILPTVEIKFNDDFMRIKTTRIIDEIIDNLVSCETIDDINNISVISVSKEKKKKKKRATEPVEQIKKIIISEEPEQPMVKKKVKRIKFF